MAAQQARQAHRYTLRDATAGGERGTSRRAGRNVYTVSRAHFDFTVGYLVAANSDLTPKWHASLGRRLHDGCGVLVPIAKRKNQPNACREGTTLGVDPTTNDWGSGSVSGRGFVDSYGFAGRKRAHGSDYELQLLSRSPDEVQRWGRVFGRLRFRVGFDSGGISARRHLLDCAQE